MPTARVASVLVVLAGITALGGLTACNIRQETFTDDTTQQVVITEVNVDGGSGDIVVHGDEPSQVDIHRTFRYRHERVVDTYRIEGTVLHVAARCGDECSVSYVIRAPKGVKISGHNGSGNLRASSVSTVDFSVGSGDVSVRGATGALVVHTRSGNVELVDVAGPVTIGTGSGDIDGLDVRATDVTTETSSGNIKLDLSSVADVRAKTGSGDIRLAVSTGDYRISTDTGSGDVDVRIAHNPNGARHLDLRTGSGNIVVNPR
ncbi:MAG TPA: DUF4097 family beta strand repeat-containing protein [Micromonosporaceae bacterium]|jgi:hypothetical protein|nr:DUF4097 family beta strand repeat-containing protein [Micromonosporaceae bacterium]